MLKALLPLARGRASLIKIILMIPRASLIKIAFMIETIYIVGVPNPKAL
jgi:hypothetical protein